MSETGYRSKQPDRGFSDEGHRLRPVRKKTKPIAAAAGFVLLAATIVFALVFIPPHETNGVPEEPAPSASAYVSAVPSPSAASSAAPAEDAVALAPPAAAALIYENAGQVFLLSGKNRTSIGESSLLYACYDSASIMFSGDNRHIFYITGLQSDTGQGTLMTASPDGSSPSQTVAEGVCCANVSYDGKKVMYITGIEGAAGTLYLKEGDKAEQIAQNVVPYQLLFSYRGEYISYIVRESEDIYAMYLKKSGRAPELVTRISASAVTDNGLRLTRFNDASVLDSGQLLYSIEENYNMPLYLYSLGGGTERLCNDGYIVETFTTGGFLYAETGRDKKPLWYKAADGEPVMVSENYDYIKLMQHWPGAESRFLLVEHIGEGADNPGVMMYEAEPGGAKTAISLADGGFDINSSLDCVTYQRDAKLYVSRKTQAGWKEAFLSDASSMEFQGAISSGIVAEFDDSGENLYYFDELKTSPLYRYSVRDGVTEKVADSADWFTVAGDMPYTHTAGDKLYRGANPPGMILEGVRKVVETQGGEYLLTQDKAVWFTAEGEDAVRILDSYTNTVDASETIRYYPPLGEDAGCALGVLSGEVNYCLYKLGVFRDKYDAPIGTDEAVALASKLLLRDDLGETERAVLEKMKAGLDAYTLWADGKIKRGAAAAALEKASESYSSYIAGTAAGE